MSSAFLPVSDCLTPPESHEGSNSRAERSVDSFYNKFATAVKRKSLSEPRFAMKSGGIMCKGTDCWRPSEKVGHFPDLVLSRRPLPCVPEACGPHQHSGRTCPFSAWHRSQAAQQAQGSRHPLVSMGSGAGGFSAEREAWTGGSSTAFSAGPDSGDSQEKPYLEGKPSQVPEPQESSSRNACGISEQIISLTSVAVILAHLTCSNLWVGRSHVGLMRYPEPRQPCPKSWGREQLEGAQPGFWLSVSSQAQPACRSPWLLP